MDFKELLQGKMKNGNEKAIEKSSVERAMSLFLWMIRKHRCQRCAPQKAIQPGTIKFYGSTCMFRS